VKQKPPPVLTSAHFVNVFVNFSLPFQALQLTPTLRNSKSTSVSFSEPALRSNFVYRLKQQEKLIEEERTMTKSQPPSDNSLPPPASVATSHQARLLPPPHHWVLSHLMLCCGAGSCRVACCAARCVRRRDGKIASHDQSREACRN
jgi:hypothetical protein